MLPAHASPHSFTPPGYFSFANTSEALAAGHGWAETASYLTDHLWSQGFEFNVT